MMLPAILNIFCEKKQKEMMLQNKQLHKTRSTKLNIGSSTSNANASEEEDWFNYRPDKELYGDCCRDCKLVRI